MEQALRHLLVRGALARTYFGGYTQSEVAELINGPLGTLKTRMFAAMWLLRHL